MRADDSKAHVLVAPAANASGDPVAKLYGLFFAVTALALLITAVVALITATRVSRPITALVDDVRSISNGNLSHRVRAQGGGEVGLLAGAIDRMTEALRDARDTEVELFVREREREVAMEVQEALQPTDFEVPEGYSVASEHVGSSEPGGDFHDIVLADDERTVFFACDVSGAGVPGALVGAMARAYLRSELKKGGSLADALKNVNRTIAGEVRRGMYVTVLAAALDSDTHELEVAAAGHKLPLVHWCAADKSIRAIQPDGIALGFDKGPVFDRGISVRHIPMDPGDRVVIAGTGAVRVINMAGDEIGEKRFYKLFARNAEDAPAEVLDGVLTALEAFADEEPFPTDVSLIVLGRDA
ncbi:MAG: sigma-B regulation protein RsbU (phosphoserine phosphatase) [Planctomycetota bacterium]